MALVESGHSGCPRCAGLAALLAAASARAAALEQRVAELEARLNQDSSNSSRPPSSDPPSAPRLPKKKPTGRKPGGQPGHRGHHRVRLPPERVTRTIDYVPGSCRGCGAGLSFDPQPGDPEPSWHQVAELPPVAAEVTEHRGHARACPCCGAVTREPVPPQVRSRVLGPRLSGLMAYLSGRCHDGRRVVEEFLEDVLGVPVGLGSVSAYEAEAADALGGAYGQAAAEVRGSGSRNVDETGWGKDWDAADAGGKRRWLWVAACRAAAVFAVHASRGYDALASLLGLGGATGGAAGVVCSDRYAAYAALPAGMRQVCWAHLLRDFTKWSQPGGHSTLARAVGQEGREIAEKVLGLWRDFRERKIDRAALDRGLKPLKERLGEVLRAGAELDSPRDEKAAVFCRNLLAVETALWTFARADVVDGGAGVEPTNNHAERCLRPAVLWRKNCHGSASDRGCRFVERVLTVVTTLRLRGRNVLDYLHRAIEAHRLGLPAPSLTA